MSIGVAIGYYSSSEEVLQAQGGALMQGRLALEGCYPMDMPMMGLLMLGKPI